MAVNGLCEQVDHISIYTLTDVTGRICLNQATIFFLYFGKQHQLDLLHYIMGRYKQEGFKAKIVLHTCFVEIMNLSDVAEIEELSTLAFLPLSFFPSAFQTIKTFPVQATPALDFNTNTDRDTQATKQIHIQTVILHCTPIVHIRSR